MALKANLNNCMKPLDNRIFFDILIVAKTTRYDPLGMAGFCLQIL